MRTSARRSTSSSTTRARRSSWSDGPTAGAGPGRAQHDALPPARRVRRDLALELPARDPDRDGGRRARGRERRDPEAGRAVARVGARVRRGAARGRGARRTPSSCSPARATWERRSCRHRGVATIAFTGSRPVGLGDRRRPRPAPPPGQQHVKRVVSEMGGKNCVIVDSDADLDDAVPAIVDLGVRLRRAEVLGRRARARARGDRGRADRAHARARSSCCRSVRQRTSPRRFRR